MNTPVDAARRARRGLTAVLCVTALAALGYGFLVPAVDAADPAKRVTFTPTSVKPFPRRARTPGLPGPVLFPLVTSSDHRSLQDQNGQPFPILGRASWSVISLTQADYTTYLDDTAAKGFNAIELNIIVRADRNLSRPLPATEPPRSRPRSVDRQPVQVLPEHRLDARGGLRNEPEHVQRLAAGRRAGPPFGLEERLGPAEHHLLGRMGW